jgi:capsular polysaccharide transport system permease protein
MADGSPDQPLAAPSQVVRAPAPPQAEEQRAAFPRLAFLLLVTLPVLLTALYLWTRAADQYASYLAFSVRAEGQSPAVELLGGVKAPSGGTSSDTDILQSFLTSHALVQQVADRVDLGAAWGRAWPGDPIFALSPGGTVEELRSHWRRKVSITHDSKAGLIELRVLAFAPQDAQEIAEAILAECTEMINSLSAAARRDAIGHSVAELAEAETRLREARRALTRFRNRTQIVDPGIDTRNQMGLLVTLQRQLAEALIEADLLHQRVPDSDPRVTRARDRIGVIRARIAAERSNLGLGEEGEGQGAFADLVGRYEGLVVDREFAESAYTAAMAVHDASLAQARRQSRYLAAHVRPTLAQGAEYPRRLMLLALVALFCTVAWAITCLIWQGLRDRR